MEDLSEISSEESFKLVDNNGKRLQQLIDAKGHTIDHLMNRANNFEQGLFGIFIHNFFNFPFLKNLMVALERSSQNTSKCM